MYSSPSHTKPAISQNRWHNTDLFQSFDHQNVIRGNMVSRSASRTKTPLKAVDVDLSNTSYSLQANDRTVVGNSTIFGSYESHDQGIQYRNSYQNSSLSDFMRQTPGSSNVASLFGCYGRQQVCLHFHSSHCLFVILQILVMACLFVF